MKQIKIGTCVPGPVAEEWLKGFVGKGFETFSLNFHMSLEGTDLDKLAPVSYTHLDVYKRQV